ncbi:MAG: sigma 54-interacting transcriptional regulator [Peptococcaceae bacterium]|jgi:transcriptional regulator with PAS, ATPase and Fis domain|nr:sigma 54-interacting transcriptional regulator [Peptococcaceae bacterium]MDH7524950.1 sigma 54-interacting transcriptional regulator [Peptococcaceae bacterium]
MLRTDLDEIKKEWIKMTNGQAVNTNIVKPYIRESWQRSLAFKVNPYQISEELFLSNEEIEKLSALEHIKESYGDIVSAIKDVALEMELTVEIFDQNARIQGILAFSGVFHLNKEPQQKYIIFRDLSEEKIGTNAVILALKEGKPIQLRGPEHFNHGLQNANCSAAPIHDVNGKIIGAINIVSHSKSQTVETLGLVTSIAKILDDYTLIRNMLDQLTVYNSTLNEIIEYLPQGIIWVNSQNQIESYNKKVFRMLEMEEAHKDYNLSKERLGRYLKQIDSLASKKELDQREIVLEVNNIKKSFLISIKDILDKQQQIKGKLVVFEDTHKILRNTFRGDGAIYTFADIVGESREITELKKMANKIAKSSSAILIYGDNGTGKELLAQGIHNASLRRDKPFVAINCGAIPSELIESELFGYEPGSFTGALKGGKIGKLEAASGGTLFLDEVESMPLHVQIKLLRVLSTNKITKIGGINEVPIDVRIISATKKDLLKEVEQGSFREDFYFRISVITLKIPPLRERKEDIPLLVSYFIRMFSKQLEIEGVTVTNEFMQALSSYNWRGNIRELRNVIERAMLLLGNERQLTIAALPERIIKSYEYHSKKQKIEAIIKANKDEASRGILRDIEKYVIESILKEEGGNITKTAERLGISRPTLYKKMQENEIK